MPNSVRGRGRGRGRNREAAIHAPSSEPPPRAFRRSTRLARGGTPLPPPSQGEDPQSARGSLTVYSPQPHFSVPSTPNRAMVSQAVQTSPTQGRGRVADRDERAPSPVSECDDVLPYAGVGGQPPGRASGSSGGTRSDAGRRLQELIRRAASAERVREEVEGEAQRLLMAEREEQLRRQVERNNQLLAGADEHAASLQQLEAADQAELDERRRSDAARQLAMQAELDERRRSDAVRQLVTQAELDAFQLDHDAEQLADELDDAEQLADELDFEQGIQEAAGRVAVRSWDEQRRMDAVRRARQRAVNRPRRHGRYVNLNIGARLRELSGIRQAVLDNVHGRAGQGAAPAVAAPAGGGYGGDVVMADTDESSEDLDQEPERNVRALERRLSPDPPNAVVTAYLRYTSMMRSIEAFYDRCIGLQEDIAYIFKYEEVSPERTAILRAMDRNVEVFAFRLLGLKPDMILDYRIGEAHLAEPRYGRSLDIGRVMLRTLIVGTGAAISISPESARRMGEIDDELLVPGRRAEGIFEDRHLPRRGRRGQDGAHPYREESERVLGVVGAYRTRLKEKNRMLCSIVRDVGWDSRRRDHLDAVHGLGVSLEAQLEATRGYIEDAIRDYPTSDTGILFGEEVAMLRDNQRAYEILLRIIISMTAGDMHTMGRVSYNFMDPMSDHTVAGLGIRSRVWRER